MVDSVVFIKVAGTGSILLPATWNPAANMVEAIGGGAGGGNDTSTGYAGGGAAYAGIFNFPGIAGDSVPYHVAAGGQGNPYQQHDLYTAGEQSWFFDVSTLLADGGYLDLDGDVDALGGQASASVGDVKYDGGRGGGGGGGAAGPFGPGLNSNDPRIGGPWTVAQLRGGAGDVDSGGAGTVHGGADVPNTGTPPLNGLPGTEWLSDLAEVGGAGSGGAGQTGGFGAQGGDGGLYGAGGACTFGPFRGGHGAQGLIRLSWTPLILPDRFLRPRPLLVAPGRL